MPVSRPSSASDPDAVPVLAARAVARSFHVGESTVQALAGVDLEVGEGELVVIAGPSGSGKSTLLHLLGALDRPDAGQIRIEGRDVAALSEHGRTLLRRRRLGFVFQAFHLVPVLSAVENVELPLLVDGIPRRERRERAVTELERVGLAARLDHRPDRLSGGERQRVAVARALVHRPRAVLADEPTGNLDSDNALRVFDLLAELGAAAGTTIVISTHDPLLVDRSPRIVRLRDGRVESDLRTAGVPA
ncbi:MAG: ABC transporter ATP-binding protein [Thermoanaerobaculia bacterium]|nr:MAG: ABC transporter ATP-binding protein [Thermoanaerobaculia bacterium]MBZ0103400.1 ABC transporter ATP-binding protein [Thermoanaerobaculia bacterium]